MKCKLGTAAALALAMAGPSLAINLGDAVNLNGYTSFEFEKMWEENGKGDKNASWDADMFDLVFNITPVERLRIATDLTWEHGAASENAWGNIGIEYGFVEYTATNWFKIRAGKMFTPFGIYTEIHTAKPTFLSVKEPLATGKTEKIGSKTTLANESETVEFDQVNRFFPRWGAGISILGNIPLGGTMLDYNIQVSNGEAAAIIPGNDAPYDKDDNPQKAIAARVRFSPYDDLRVGLSGYRDQRAVYVVDEEGAVTTTDENRKLYSVGGQVEWNPGNFGLEYELIYGGIHTGDAEIPVQKRIGMSAQLSYLLFDRLTPYGRMEFFDPNRDSEKEDDQVTIITAGLNFQVIPGNLFLKVDNNTYLGQKKNSVFKKFEDVGYKYNELHAAVVVGF